MPSAVVKVTDLLLVLHHVCWLASLLVFHCNVVLDGLKIFPMLEAKKGSGEKTMSKDLHGETFELTRLHPLPRTAPQKSCFCPRHSRIPTADGLASGYQLALPSL